MRLVNVFFIVLLLLVLMVLGNLYLTNHDLLVREVVVFGKASNCRASSSLRSCLDFS